MQKYSCFNRAPASPTLRVQTGWIDGGGTTRYPLMQDIPNVFADDPSCRYDNKQKDVRCEGCEHAVPI